MVVDSILARCVGSFATFRSLSPTPAGPLSSAPAVAPGPSAVPPITINAASTLAPRMPVVTGTDPFRYLASRCQFHIGSGARPFTSCRELIGRTERPVTGTGSTDIEEM